MLHQRALIANIARAANVARVANIASMALGLACLSLAAPTPADAKPAKGVKAAQAAKAAAPGRPMTPGELRDLYSGKTWMWANGGGYMDPSGRFRAVAGKDYARGTWQASGGGRMCFGGLWTSGTKRSQGRTCFSHRVLGDTIYQRKEPSGTWYAFKHSPVRGTDEFSKLVEGDRISDQLKQVQAALSAN
jgi:hypothetical protein